MKAEELELEKARGIIAQYNLARSGGGVRRYHTHRVVCEDTVASHSWGVAVIVDILYAGSAPAHVLRAALYHDVAEHILGDIPSPTKHLLNSEELRRKEDKIMKDNGMSTYLTEWETFILKLADIFDGMIYCVEERERGNTTLVPVWETYRGYMIGKMRLSLPKFEKEIGKGAGQAAFNVIADRLGYLSGLIWSRMENANAQR